jgi:hypothetical protein
MIRKLDRYWFRVLGAVHGWVLRRAQAHCRREMVHRLERHLAWQKAHLN